MASVGRGVQQYYELLVAIQYNQNGRTTRTTTQINKQHISTYLHNNIKNYPGFTSKSHLFSKINAQNFYPKVLEYICKNVKMISTKHNAFSTNKTVILVVTVHFQRITFPSSVLKCKPNHLLTASNKPSDDMVCANAKWLHHCRMV